MSHDAALLLQQILHLDERDRASIAGALLESLEERPEAQCEAAWAEVIGRRVQELESGAVAGIPWSSVRQRLFHGFE